MAKTMSSISIGNKMVGDMPSSPSATLNRDEGRIDAKQQHKPPAAQHAKQNMFPRYTDHTYHDFASYLKEGGKIEKHKKCDRNFPARLHAILSDEQYAHIISWMPHGRAWKVRDKELLVDVVIPKFFGQSKFASFTRQLSGWGFKRLHQTGPDFGCYYHECFLRGHPRLTVLMRRTSPGKGKAAPNVHAEPDFYVIAKQFPLESSPNAPGETAAVTAPTNYKWDPYHQTDDKRTPHHAAHATAAYQKKESNSPNQHIKPKSVGGHHSFPSSDEAREELERRTASRAQEEMNYDYFAMSNPHSLESHRFSSMQAHQEAIMNQYYPSNVYQHTPGSLHHDAAAQYFPHSQYSQQQQQQQQQQQHVHDYYRYTNPYYSNFYNDGQIPGSNHGQASGSASQMGYPTQEYSNPLLFHPSYKSYFEDKSEGQEQEPHYEQQP